MTFVVKTIEDSIGTIMLNHGQKRNALSQPLIADILEALTAFRQQNLRVIILRAQEGATVWSAGHDVSELPQGHRDPLGWDDPLRRLIREVENYPAPIIAMIEGSVWGGACEVAFACDLVIAADDTTFAITPAKLGVPYNLTGLLTFMNAISLHIVKELAFTDFNLSTSTVERATHSFQQVENFERENAPAFTETDHEFIRRAKNIITTCLTRLQTPHQKTRLNTRCPVCRNYDTTCTGSESPPTDTPTQSQTQLTTSNGLLFL